MKKTIFLVLFALAFISLLGFCVSDAQSSIKVLNTFQNPPSHYGPVPLWWWDGDKLDQDRITWQLERLLEGGVPSVCFIQKYPLGPPMGPQAPYFSESWWDYMIHTARQCDRLGMNLWVHDESYCRPRKNYWQNHIEAQIENHPEFQGNIVGYIGEDFTGPVEASIDWPNDMTLLLTAAYPRKENGSIDLEEKVDLSEYVMGDSLTWKAPSGNWFVTAIGYRPRGLNRTTKDVVNTFLNVHHEEYKRRLGTLFEKVYAGTFQDELYILKGIPPCGPNVIEAFESKKGYDPVPLLPGLYQDIGPQTDRIRCDYYDVVTQMLEDNWFKPLYQWHEKQGLQFSHDNWGRNNIADQTRQYGDYYRTMRWYQVPGYDDGGPYQGLGTRNFFDAKLAASIAACYKRPRVWCEAFHTTGWGLTPELQLAMTVENYCYGANLYDKHGLYYSTLGGWYEHAPPDVHFRQPYWHHAQSLYQPITRLSYLFSQGHPVADIALLYPATTMHAQWQAVGGISDLGKSIDKSTRKLARRLYDAGLDLMFVDDESLAKAQVKNGKLIISGMPFRVLLFGPNTTVKQDSIAKAKQFFDAGGVVVGFERLPDASAEKGRGDKQLLRTLEHIFSKDNSENVGDKPVVNQNSNSGTGIYISNNESKLIASIDHTITRDVITSTTGIFHTHRRIGDLDAYLLLNTSDQSQSVQIHFRTSGAPFIWDTLTGEEQALHTYKHQKPYTVLELNFAPRQHHVVVFKPKGNGYRVEKTTLSKIDKIETDNNTLILSGWIDRPGDHETSIHFNGFTYKDSRTITSVPKTILLNDDWTFSLKPALDNRWGDFRYPSSDEHISTEIRHFAYRQEKAGQNGLEEKWYQGDEDESVWQEYRYSYGPGLWISELYSPDAEPPSPPTAQDQSGWQPYTFSYLFGKPGTHPDDHGFNSIVSDDFLVTPRGEGIYYFWTSVMGIKSDRIFCTYGNGIHQIWINEKPLFDQTPSQNGSKQCTLKDGENPILIAQKARTHSHICFSIDKTRVAELDMNHIPRVRWFYRGSGFRFNPHPWDQKQIGWYRFQLPAGSRALSLPFKNSSKVWIENEEIKVQNSNIELDRPLNNPKIAYVRTQIPTGRYGGMAWEEPAKLELKPVSVSTGDWSQLGLTGYSGLGIYRKTIELNDMPEDSRIILDLGDVRASASVTVNKKHIETRISRPFRFDITEVIHPGANTIEIEVANTLANYWSEETPTRYIYEGDRRAGLLGPVTLHIEPKIQFQWAMN